MTGTGLAVPILALGALLASADVLALPLPAGATPEASAPLCARSAQSSDPRAAGSWIDCYVSCVEAERERCVEQCGSRDPMSNPCLAICYDAVALGCAIGCTHFAQRPEVVIGETP